MRLRALDAMTGRDRRAPLWSRATLGRALAPGSIAATLWLLQWAGRGGRALERALAPPPRTPIVAVVRGGRLLSAAEVRGPQLDPRSVPSPDTWGRTLPLVDAHVPDATGRSGHFAASPFEHETAIHVAPGDEVLVAVYVATTSTRAARGPEVGDVVASVSVDPPGEPSTAHALVAVVSGRDVPPVSSRFFEWGGDVALRSPRPTTLTYVAGSAALCRIPDPATRAAATPDPRDACRADPADAADARTNTPLALPSGSGLPSWSLGDLPPGYHGVLTFRARVVAARR